MKEATRRRRGRRASRWARERAADVAAQGARDGRRPGRARRRRRRRGLRPRRDEPRAREGARARERPTSSSSASRPATRTAPSSGPRSPTGCACRSSRRRRRSSVADGKVTVKRQTEYGYDVIEAPLPARRRRLGRDQRAALPVAQGDHGREEEAAGDALGWPISASTPDEVGEAGSRHRGARARRPAAARGDTQRIEDDGGGSPSRSSTTSRRGSSI